MSQRKSIFIRTSKPIKVETRIPMEILADNLKLTLKEELSALSR